MVNIKFVVVLGLLFTISLGVMADTSQDQTHSKDVKSSENTDNVEPQQRGRRGCKHGCCGSYAYGQCSYCCPSLKAAEGAPAGESNVVEPQQRGGCRRGCCGSYAHGQCSYCCP